MEICVIAFNLSSFLLPNCPPPPVANTMECTVQRISSFSKYHMICWDPKTKEIVYDRKVQEQTSA
jgi:hypothetical protein